MACTLSARGRDFDVETFLTRTRLPIKEAHFWIRGTPIYNLKRKHHDSGFSEWVSEDRWDDMDAAIAEVTKFLNAYVRELRKLKRTKGADEIMLHFAINSRLGKKVWIQGEYLPPDLLRLAGELNIGIALSIYPPFGEKPATRKKTRNVANILTNKEFRQWLHSQDRPGIRSRRGRMGRLR